MTTNSTILTRTVSPSITIHRQLYKRRSRVARFGRWLYQKGARLGRALPITITTPRRARQALVDGYDRMASCRAAAGDEVGAAYYAACARAIREALDLSPPPRDLASHPYRVE